MVRDGYPALQDEDDARRPAALGAGKEVLKRLQDPRHLGTEARELDGSAAPRDRKVPPPVGDVLVLEAEAVRQVGA